MNIKLTKEQAQDLISFVDTKLSNSLCDHSLRYANEWANSNNVDQDDFIDILEDNGAFCDCEVVANLPNDSDVIVSAKQDNNDVSNPWKIPKSFEFRVKGSNLCLTIGLLSDMFTPCHAPCE